LRDINKSYKMPSSYQQRINENKELRKRNKELEEEVEKMRNAINILNSCIHNIDMIKIANDDDLKIQYKELCNEMEED
jgi:cell division septum initiation protein DivIVA